MVDGFAIMLNHRGARRYSQRDTERGNEELHGDAIRIWERPRVVVYFFTNRKDPNSLRSK